MTEGISGATDKGCQIQQGQIAVSWLIWVDETGYRLFHRGSTTGFCVHGSIQISPGDAHRVGIQDGRGLVISEASDGICNILTDTG
jgi:hypothetical protein